MFRAAVGPRFVPGGGFRRLGPTAPARRWAARLRGDMKARSMSLKITPDNEIKCTDWKITKAHMPTFSSWRSRCLERSSITGTT
jgi:hypothetical protein